MKIRLSKEQELPLGKAFCECVEYSKFYKIFFHSYNFCYVIQVISGEDDPPDDDPRQV